MPRVDVMRAEGRLGRREVAGVVDEQLEQLAPGEQLGGGRGGVRLQTSDEFEMPARTSVEASHSLQDVQSCRSPPSLTTLAA